MRYFGFTILMLILLGTGCATPNSDRSIERAHMTHSSELKADGERKSPPSQLARTAQKKSPFCVYGPLKKR